MSRVGSKWVNRYENDSDEDHNYQPKAAAGVRSSRNLSDKRSRYLHRDLSSDESEDERFRSNRNSKEISNSKFIYQEDRVKDEEAGEGGFRVRNRIQTRQRVTSGKPDERTFVPKSMQSNEPVQHSRPAFSEEPDMKRSLSREGSGGQWGQKSAGLRNSNNNFSQPSQARNSRNGPLPSSDSATNNSQEWAKGGKASKDFSDPPRSNHPPLQPSSQPWARGGSQINVGGWVQGSDEPRRDSRAEAYSVAVGRGRGASEASQQGGRRSRESSAFEAEETKRRNAERTDRSFRRSHDEMPYISRAVDLSGEEEEEDNQSRSSTVQEHNTENHPPRQRDLPTHQNEIKTRRGNKSSVHFNQEANVDTTDTANTSPDSDQAFLRVWHPAGEDSPKRPSNASQSQGQNNLKPSFVLVAHPRGVRHQHVQCTVVRDRTSMQGKLYPQYELILDDPRRTLIIARKMSLNRTSNYHLFDMTRGQAGSKLSKKAGNYLGKLRARNTNRTDYSLVSLKEDKEEIAGISFEKVTILDQLKEGNQPRKMKVLLPLPDTETGTTEGVNAVNYGSLSLPDLLNEVAEDKKVLPEGLMLMETKEPVLENGNYRLNFYGRVNLPSVKNFQIVHYSNIDNILCQFGKVEEDVFHLDYKHPFNAMQAFALALCQFNL